MRRFPCQVACLMVFSLLAAGTAADNAGRSLKVNVTYTGEVPVDESHRLYVLVYDTSYIGHATTSPISSESLLQTGGSVVFRTLPKSPVYVAAFVDKTGEYEADSGSPPSGSPAWLYGEQAGIADPIELTEGKTIEIGFSFDDSLIMP